MNLDLIIDLLAYKGSATNNPSDAVRVKETLQDLGIKALNRLQFPLDADEEKDVALPGMDAALYTAILVDRSITVNLNGSEDSLTLTPRASGTRTLVLFTRGSVSSLKIKNTSAAEANVDILVASK